MAKFPVNTTHYNEMMRYAKLHGLEVKHGTTKGADLMAIFGDIWPGMTEFELSDDGTAAPGQPAQEALPSYAAQRQATPGDDETHYSFDPKVTVNIPSDPENGGSHPVPICVNGDHILVQRNTDVPIPYRFYDALKIAVETNYRQEPGVNGKPETIQERRHAFRFSTLDMPSKDEIAAYKARAATIGVDKVEDPTLAPMPNGGVGVTPQAAAFLEALSGMMANQQAAA